MDLTLDEHEEAFRAQVQRWLVAHVPDDLLPPIYTEEGVQAHRIWERQLFDAGYAALHWPKEFGGADADLITQSIFQEELVVPERYGGIGVGDLELAVMLEAASRVALPEPPAGETEAARRARRSHSSSRIVWPVMPQTWSSGQTTSSQIQKVG